MAVASASQRPAAGSRSDAGNPPASTQPAAPKPPPLARATDVLQPPAYMLQSRVHAVQSGNFRYERPAKNVVTYLRLLPPEQHGAQKRLETELTFAPIPHAQPRGLDKWNNELVEVRHEAIEAHLTYVADMTVQNVGCYSADHFFLPQGVLAGRRMREFLEETPLTAADDSIRAFAAETRDSLPDGGASDSLALFVALGGRVFTTMAFQSGVTGTRTTAQEAFAGKVGVCQDYTHILISLCRASGLPARYVSGFVPAEGAMHAWVEAALVLENESPRWYAFDPTHNRWVNERYITVATGRDYHDILPTSGTYYGGGASVLSHRSRAAVVETHRLDNLVSGGRTFP